MGINVVLFFNRPEPCTEIFMTKNKYFDKHPRTLKMGKILFGDSILFAKSDIVWQQKRKVLSSALYKEKLKLMIDMIKDATIDTIRNEWLKTDNHTIDIVKAASRLIIKINLKCLFGGDNTEIKVLQRINGVESMQPLGETMISLMEANTVRNL